MSAYAYVSTCSGYMCFCRQEKQISNLVNRSASEVQEAIFTSWESAGGCLEQRIWHVLSSTSKKNIKNCIKICLGVHTHQNTLHIEKKFELS